ASGSPSGRPTSFACGSWLSRLRRRGSRRAPRRTPFMDRELLLEIGVEEMPASWLPGLTTELAARLEHRLTEAGLPIKTPIESHSTPRRLAACAPELVDRQEDRDETVMGPAVSAAFDAEGH